MRVGSSAEARFFVPGVSMSFSFAWPRHVAVSFAVIAFASVTPAFALTISGTPPASVQPHDQYVFRPTVGDAQGRVRYSISNRPSWAYFSSRSGTLAGTPRRRDARVYSNIVITASDGVSTARLNPFSITVGSPTTPTPTPTPTNRAPTISGSPAVTASVGQAYSFSPTASDPDGNALTFSITNKPAWATFSTSSGQLSGTPTAAGTSSNITISVSDGQLSASLAAFAIQVAGSTTTTNRAPTISGSPATTVIAGATYSFQPTATDADGDPLSYSVQNKPSWATFSIANGKLSGTPTTVGTASNIVISVSDGKVSTSLAAFAVQVQTATPTNSAPAISGAPATTAKVGAAYSFRPTASDADGDALTFAITNKPAWATFSASTGQLSGTPATADGGTTAANIQISVSDGKTSMALAAFSIAVSATTTSSVTLDWAPPTANTDGSSLTNLAGYRIVYGSSPSALNTTVQLANPGLSSYVVDGLTSGTWYFSVKAYNNAGQESVPTNPVQTVVP